MRRKTARCLSLSQWFTKSFYCLLRKVPPSRTYTMRYKSRMFCWINDLRKTRAVKNASVPPESALFVLRLTEVNQTR